MLTNKVSPTPLCQVNNVTFRLIVMQPPSHHILALSCLTKLILLRFTLRAVLNGKAYPDGVGKNKKEARQRAAENVLRSLLEESIDSVRLSCFYLKRCMCKSSQAYVSLMCCHLTEINKKCSRSSDHTSPSGRYHSNQLCILAQWIWSKEQDDYKSCGVNETGTK